MSDRATRRVTSGRDGEDRTPRGWDVHAHLVPEALRSEAGAGRLGLAIEAGRCHLDGAPIAGALDVGTGELVEWLDSRGLAGAVVSVPPPLYRHRLPRADASEWASLLNSGLDELVGAAPERLRALAFLPLSAPEEAAREAESRTGRSWVGFLVGTSAPGRTLADPALEQLWSVLDERGSFVFVHPVDHPDERLDRFYLRNLLGNPVETGLAAASLVFSDAVARYPRIRFCLAHGGGVTSVLSGRWERGHATSRPGIGSLTLSPAQALARMFVDSVTCSRPALELAIDTFGVDHVLLGSDWPFPMGDEDPVAALSDLPGPRRTRIAHENAERELIDGAPDRQVGAGR